ncbi:MAG TPA: helix-turn-helix domain-containing protein [Gaiellaceae bacterium]|nr:helix-turn-helix domain-containing protein [Gaiellaceae bacterium]
MSDLRDLFAPELVEALEDFVDERIAAALGERENGSEPSWLSIEEAAEYLRVSPSTIARMLKQGRVRSSYVGRRRLVRRSDLDQQVVERLPRRG